jgi:hypothetical protein
MDLTKKQVARDGVSWKVRAATGGESTNRVEGVVEAEFREWKIRTLRLRAGIRAG